jgi:hypothetical protein
LLLAWRESPLSLLGLARVQQWKRSMSQVPQGEMIEEIRVIFVYSPYYKGFSHFF